MQTRHPLTQVIVSYLIASRDQLGSQRLIAQPKAKHLELFRRCFQTEPRAVVEAWLKRNSDFEFMEHIVAPRAPIVASLLSDLLRDAERIYEQLASEADQDRLTLKRCALTELELPLVDALTESSAWRRLTDGWPLSLDSPKGLSDSSELNERDQLRVDDEEAPAKGSMKPSLMANLDRSLVMIHEVLSSAIQLNAYSGLPHEQGCYSLDRALKALGVDASFDQVAELSREAIEHTWARHLDDEWVNHHLESSELSSALIEVRARWLAIWSGESEGGYANVSISDEERRSLAIETWESVTASYCSEYARRLLRGVRAAEVARDICVSFEALIDKKRPKAQQLGAFMVTPGQPDLINIVFLTRDGRYLAQRELEWDSRDPETISDAFEPINVSTLICSVEMSERFPQAIDVLSYQYDIRIVVTDVFEAPERGSSEELKSFLLALGGCDVAPLRFWIRADYERLITALTSPEIFSALSVSGYAPILQQELNQMCAQRWLALRQKRTLQGRKASGSPAHHARRSVDSAMNRCEVGDVIEVMITQVSGRSVSVLTSLGEGGYVELSRSEWTAFGHARDDLSVGATLRVRALEIHPLTGVIKFMLERATIELERETAGGSSPMGDLHADDSATHDAPMNVRAASYLNYVSMPDSAQHSEELGTAERINSLFKR